jgi:hypothetical protein
MCLSALCGPGFQKNDKRELVFPAAPSILSFSLEGIQKAKQGVDYACNPSFSGGGGRRIIVQDWPRHKFENLCENKLKKLQDWGVWLTW